MSFHNNSPNSIVKNKMLNLCGQPTFSAGCSGFLRSDGPVHLLQVAFSFFFMASLCCCAAVCKLGRRRRSYLNSCLATLRNRIIAVFCLRGKIQILNTRQFFGARPNRRSIAPTLFVAGLRGLSCPGTCQYGKCQLNPRENPGNQAPLWLYCDLLKSELKRINY